MQKKLIYGLTVFLLATGFLSSCTDEGMSQTPKDDDSQITPEVPEEEGYFSFDFSAEKNTNKTKAHNPNGDLSPGTDNERKVGNIHILLYDMVTDPYTSKTSPGMLLYHFELDATNGDGTQDFSGTDVSDNSAPNNYKFIAKARKVLFRDYYMMVLANVNEDSPDVYLEDHMNPENNQTYSDFENLAWNGSKILSDMAKPDGVILNRYEKIFMSNDRGLYPIYKDLHLKETPTAAETNEFIPRIGLDRIFVKVLAYNKTSGNILDDGSELISATWELDKTAKYVYLARKSALDAQESNEKDYKTFSKDEYENYYNYYTERYLLYAESPAWTRSEWMSWGGLAGFFNTKSDFSVEFANLFDSNDSHDIYDYCFENTMSKADQGNLDQTTSFILRAIIQPKGIPAGASYYSYKSQDGTRSIVFTHADAYGWYTGSYPTDDPIYTELATAITAEMTKTGGNKVFDFSSSTEPVKYIARTNNRLLFHKDRVNIYEVPIKHFGYDYTMQYPYPDPSEVYGYYGVVRNNIYKIVVNKISGPTNSYISAEITVNEWYVRNDQNEDLEHK